MVEFGKLTGEIENNLLRVQFRTGEKFWAPMVVMGTSVSLPSKEWIDKNHKNFLALVSFEKDILENPMIIGFYPINGATSSDFNNFERLLELISSLIETLQNATTMTKLGPQKLMSDTQTQLSKEKKELEDIKKNILNLNL